MSVIDIIYRLFSNLNNIKTHYLKVFITSQNVTTLLEVTPIFEMINKTYLSKALFDTIFYY